MILITGGAWQGKRAFAETLVKRREEYGDGQGETEVFVSDGRRDPYETAVQRPLINGFHYFVRRLLKEGRSIEEFIREIEAGNPEAVITADELGCGIVPADPEERAWREAAGRAAGMLAADSDQVYRMVCGIPTRLK